LKIKCRDYKIRYDTQITNCNDFFDHPFVYSDTVANVSTAATRQQIN
jgi:hypothetical protein